MSTLVPLSIAAATPRGDRGGDAVPGRTSATARAEGVGDALPVRTAATATAESDGDAVLERAGSELAERIRRLFGGSFSLRHVDAGSCNGCESELRTLTYPHYDIHRLGIFITTSPRHADGLLVTGPITRAMRQPLLAVYEAMPDPKLVIAIGACACTGGVFAGSPLAPVRLDSLLPVDAYVPGCPPSPLTLIHGLLLALGRAEERRR